MFGETALHAAAKSAEVCATKALVKVGANVNAVAFNGGTPLILAAG